MMKLGKSLLAFAVAGCLLLSACGTKPAVQSSSGAGQAPASTSLPEAGEPVPVQVAALWPEPQLEELESNWYYTDDGYMLRLGWDRAQGAVDLQIPAGEDTWPSDSFAAEGGFAAVAWGKSPLRVAVTPDMGGTWNRAEIDVAAGQVYLRFSSPQHGMLAVLPGEQVYREEADCLFYTTADGGTTWQPVGSVGGVTYLLGALMLSEEVFWFSYGGAYDAETGSNSTGVCYTLDGGASWHTPEADYLPTMLRGGAEPQLQGVPHKRADGAWTLYATANRRQSLTSGGYTLVAGKDNVFRWEAPEWDLPEGVDPVMAYDYFHYFVPPATHDAASGVLTEPIEFFLACDAERYMRLKGVEIEYLDSGYYVVPVEVAQELIELQYGIAGYDVTAFGNYDPAYGGLTHIDGHGGRMEMGRQEVREVSANSDGTIRVVVAWLYMADDNPEVPYEVRQTVEQTFQPVEVNGETLFTLLASAPL